MKGIFLTKTITMSPNNQHVTEFLEKRSHPRSLEIELLRQIILGTKEGISENIKWNAPNYTFKGEDRITMRINPPKFVQLIFHRGIKKQKQPDQKLIQDGSGLLIWKENDRAIATFNSIDDIKSKTVNLTQIIIKWLDVK